MTREEMKAKAVEVMNQFGIYKSYINGFKAQDTKVCMYEGFGGYWLYQFPEIEAKVKEYEEKNNCIVFAVTHEYTDFGELYDFLYVDEYGCDITKEGNTSYLFAYVWNKDAEFCSECGEIGIKSFGGGITRVA